MKIKLIILVFFTINLVISQNVIEIKGTINEKNRDKDSIYLISGNLNKLYFEKYIYSSEIKDNSFLLKGTFSYPQMFRVSLRSEKDRVAFRSGFYFIDETTKEISLDSVKKNCEVIGVSGFEYKNKFLPYFIEKNQQKSLEAYCYNGGEEFDAKLLSYVIKNPNSFVALWVLIERFNLNGYLDIYKNTLNYFSSRLKTEKLWKILNNEIKQISIRKNENFPKLYLKNVNLKGESLILPKNKFIFIDFWFSNCKPCLEQLPMLKKLYNQYKNQGFEIISISTDKTKFIDNWKKRIIENKIPWENYLDENATIATKEKIFAFPTNLLIDQNGKVLKKDIELEDLENFLSKNLKE